MKENPYTEATYYKPGTTPYKAWEEGSEFVLNILEKARTEGIDSLSDSGIEGKVKSFLKRVHNEAIGDARNKTLEYGGSFRDDVAFVYFLKQIEALKKEVKRT